MSLKNETIGAGVEKVKISVNPNNFITKVILAIPLRKWIPTLIYLSANKKVTGVCNYEVGSMNIRRKQRTSNFTREIQLICGVFCEFVTFPLVSWVRCGTWLYRFLIFAPLLTFISPRLWNTAFLKYALYLINMFLYFMTLYLHF